MKKLIKIMSIIFLTMSLAGCKDSAKKAVEKYFALYNSLDDIVLTDMNDIVESENLSNEEKEVYVEIFKKQYSDLKYEIVSEDYEGDEAIITAKITVYDLYKVQNNASTYLANHPEEFNDENGNYDASLFIKYKLNEMKMNTDTIDYTIDFYVIKTSDGWVVSSLSNSDLEKIHGIYNYES